MSRNKMICVLLIIIIIVLVCVYVTTGNTKTNLNTNTQINSMEETQIARKRTIVQKLTSSGEIKTSKTERLELNRNKKFKRVCVSQDSIVKKDDPIVEYTNGTYLVAPYDLVVTAVVVPEKTNQNCTELNYIEVQNIEKFYIEMEVKESNINKLQVGQQVTIEVNALEDKIFEGKVSHINPIGKYENKKSVFQVLIEFENDSERQVKIGMSAFCTVIINEAKDVITLPIQSVQEENDKRYVMTKSETGEIKKQFVETGIADSNYVEIKDGISEGQKVIVPNNNSQNTEDIQSTLTLKEM